MCDFYNPTYIFDEHTSRTEIALASTTQLIAADLTRGKYQDDFKLLAPEIIEVIAKDTNLDIVCAMISWRLTSPDFANLHIYVKDNEEDYYKIQLALCEFDNNIHGCNIEAILSSWMNLGSTQFYCPTTCEHINWAKGCYAFSYDELKNMQNSKTHQDMGIKIDNSAIAVAKMFDNIKMWAETSNVKTELEHAHNQYRNANVDDICQ